MLTQINAIKDIKSNENLKKAHKNAVIIKFSYRKVDLNNKVRLGVYLLCSHQVLGLLGQEGAHWDPDRAKLFRAVS